MNSAEKSLFDVSRYKRTIQARDKTRTRKRMGNFEDYQDYLLVFMMKLVKVVVKSENLM